MKLPDILEVLSCQTTDANFEERAALDRMRSAQKFVCNLSGEASLVAYDYALQLRAFGLFRLPFAECYFEIKSFDETVNEFTTYGILCWDTPAGPKGRIYVSSNEGVNSGRATIDLLTYLPRDHNGPFEGRCKVVGDLLPLDGNGDKRGMDDQEFTRITGLLGASLAYVCIGSLALTGASKEYVPAAAKLNKSRLARGREPTYSHHIVRCVGDNGTPLSALRAVGQLRNSPRLHWRRGHVRTMRRSGKEICIPPCLVGDRSQGIVTHDYTVGR